MSLDEALGVWAEAAQDMVSAGLALATGMTYNCADLCNQAAEKALQAVYILAHHARAQYNHDLRPLGELVGAPGAILDDLDVLTPYHPGAFLEQVAPDAADDAVSGETADDLLQRARGVLRWARPIVFRPY